jgi:dipeptidyl aminopeptidase/acylaminoacyl peptidase
VFPGDGGRDVHATFYPPRHPEVEGPPGERPPLVVIVHGGPTSSTSNALALGIQFWTTRGIAVVDVDHGGSSGYGRAYRERLRGRWGIVDVADCVAAARHLADAERVDRDRMAMKGGSAGGFTTLAALVFHDVFAAGLSRYGVADLELLAAETHKFESRYMDALVGPHPGARETYRERSPIHFLERLTAPVLLLQGRDDRVVPLDQAERLVETLEARGLPYAYVCYEGEGHGFRRAETIAHAASAELVFLGRVFGFTPADPPVALDIRHLRS